MLVVHLAMDIRPEFLDHNGDGVVQHLCSPNAESVGKGARGSIVNVGQGVGGGVEASRNEGSGMVGIGGDCSRQSATHDFRVVELAMAGIGPGHKNSACGILGAARESAVAFLKKSWILMQKRRKNRAGHEVLDRKST